MQFLSFLSFFFLTGNNLTDKRVENETGGDGVCAVTVMLIHSYKICWKAMNHVLCVSSRFFSAPPTGDNRMRAVAEGAVGRSSCSD